MTHDKQLVPPVRFPEFQEAGAWESKKLDDVLYSQTSNLMHNKLKFIDTGYPVYGADGFLGYIGKHLQNEKYIAMVKDGAGVGKLFLYEKNTSVISTLNCLKAKSSNNYNLIWMFYALHNLDFSKYIVGSGIPHIYFRDYANESVLVPSFDEQRRIADCLGSLDDVIAATGEQLDALKQHKAGLMQQLFPALDHR